MEIKLANTPERVLITGIDGFVASHLADHILEVCPEVEIYGTIRRMADRKNIEHLLGDVKLMDMELTDMNSVNHVLMATRPSKVFHLAAQSYVPTSWTAPAQTLESNVIGTANVLEAVRANAPGAFVQIAGSSEEYGLVHPSESPITEDQPLRPLSPYGVSKVAADRLGYQYAHSYGMNILVTRSFNMTGPRRGIDFVDSNWASQVVQIERYHQKPIVYHGNLDAVRDFTDVRDSVRAYWMLSELEKNHNGDVVQVCTGRGHKVEDVLLALINSSNHKIPINRKLDPVRARPSDVPLLIGSNKKLRSLIDWEPEIPFEQSLEDLLNYWRSRH